MTQVILLLILFISIIILFALRMKTKEQVLSRELKIGQAQSIGTRTLQQDHMQITRNMGSLLLLMADGAGEDGQAAAKIAVDTFADMFKDYHASDKPLYFFQRAANAANQRIVNVLEERQGTASLAAVIIRDSKVYYCVVGGVSIAIYRNGHLIPVSVGQTIDVLARQRFNEGRISRSTTLALLDTQRRYNFLGQDYFQEIELFDKPIVLDRGDCVSLMSEGVTNTVGWSELEFIFERHNKKPKQIAQEVINAVNNSELVNKDNASILIVSAGEK